MKYYSILIHNSKVIKLESHFNFENALYSITEYYKNIFNDDFRNNSSAYTSLLENNILYEDVNHDNSYTFQIMKETLE